LQQLAFSFPSFFTPNFSDKKCTAGENNLTLILNRRNKLGSSNSELSLANRKKGHEFAIGYGSIKAVVVLLP